MSEKICFVNTPLQDYAKTTRKDYRTMAPLGLGHVATAAKLLDTPISRLGQKCNNP